MTPARHPVLPLAALLILAAVSFATGITWGLPSRAADPFLFGSRPPWTGQQVMALAGPWSPAGDRGSDRPQHAVSPSTAPTVVNATDADRAEIVRRYRLYSDQPYEMITFRALSRMRPGSLDLDPRLYQYGGLWVYPVGGLLRLAAAAHLVVLRTDLAFYLDHPDAFARFYVIARLYSAAWGLLGVVVVYGLTKELMTRSGAPDVHPGLPPHTDARSTLVAATAAGIYAVMPVVVNGAHEAKPHLAGTVLTLATVWAAARFARTGRGWATAGALAGAASGMVLTGIAAWAVLPVMAVRQPRPMRTLAGAVLVAGLIFVMTNPFLPFDAVFHRDRLASNVGNYGNFYRPSLSPSVLVHAGSLIAEGISPVPAIVAVLGGALLPWRRWRSANGWLLAAPAAFVAAQFSLLAAGKPAEYARFGLTLDVALAVLAATTVTRLPLRPREARLTGVLLVAATALFGLRYDLNFLADGWRGGTRRATAERLAKMAHPGRTLAVRADPAPYGLPPVDLFAWRIVVLPAGAPPRGSVLVEPTDAVPSGLASPISWANKPFRVVIPGGR